MSWKFSLGSAFQDQNSFDHFNSHQPYGKCPAKTLENKAQIVSQVSDLKSDMQ